MANAKKEVLDVQSSRAMTLLALVCIAFGLYILYVVMSNLNTDAALVVGGPVGAAIGAVLVLVGIFVYVNRRRVARLSI